MPSQGHTVSQSGPYGVTKLYKHYAIDKLVAQSPPTATGSLGFLDRQASNKVTSD